MAVITGPWCAVGCCILWGEVFPVDNWPPGRGDPAEGPFGAPEAGRKGNLVGGNHLPEEKGQHCAHSLIPETQPQPLGWALAFLSAVRNLWGVCGELCCSMGVVSLRGGWPWPRITASGLSLWASFPFLLCAEICPRCGGYCQGESDREQAFTHWEINCGGLWESVGGTHQPGDFLGEGRVPWRAEE